VRRIEALAAARRLQSFSDVRILLATCIVAGCGFDHGVLVDEGDPGTPVGDDPTVDAGPPLVSARTCKYPDSELRLCIEFDDKILSPMARDGSTHQIDANATKILEDTRNGLPAAATTLESSVRVPEHAMLDITGAITFEAWLRVPTYLAATPIGNVGQYGITIDTSGRVSCRIGTAIATSPAIGRDMWRHVACVFDGSRLRLYLDGTPASCQAATIRMPTSGTMGTWLAYNYAGGIDDIRVYARALAAPEICTHADKTTCVSTCPGNSGPGFGDDD
jgi:hypothetical protein